MEILAKARDLNFSLTPLQSNSGATAQSLANSLDSLSGTRDVLFLLKTLDPDFTVVLVEPLLEVACTVRFTSRVRELLGRLPHSEARVVVPPAVWKMLNRSDDSNAYRRMAELFDHLGLAVELQELCVRASENIDEDIREVGEDFRVD
ncbi:hypothetical protein AB0M05_35260 [Streptomyces violaceusniger]|uniref:hypothetical protein n=1 Tax=Streptomyces violaceusniger TaxID=68280 RepID=UPI003419EBCD